MNDKMYHIFQINYWFLTIPILSEFILQNEK